MDTALSDTFAALFGIEPSPQMLDWELAACIMPCWGHRPVPERLAQVALCKIIAEVHYPTHFAQDLLVRMAEIKLSEYWPWLRRVDYSPAVVTCLLKEYYDGGAI